MKNPLTVVSDDGIMCHFDTEDVVIVCEPPRESLEDWEIEDDLHILHIGLPGNTVKVTLNGPRRDALMSQIRGSKTFFKFESVTYKG